MAKDVVFDDKIRLSLKAGVDKTVRAVKYTYGPGGRAVMIDKGWGSPSVTHDGASVVDEIELTDPYENMGAQMVKAAASKTNDKSGDGSTTTSILVGAIFAEGLKHVTAGANAMAIARGIQKAVDHLAGELDKISKPIKIERNKQNPVILQIATVAANNDAVIGKFVADAMDKVSADGVVTIEEGKGIETDVKIVEGMQFDRGYASPYFITDQDAMEAVLNEPYILVYEDKISSPSDIIPLMEKLAKAKKPLLVIAEDIEGDALAILVVNKSKGILECAAVKAPGYGDRRKEMLEDIAAMTGGKAVFKDLGVNIKKLPMEYLGTARKVIIDSENTTIVEGAGDAGEIKSRIEKIKAEIAKSDSDYDREKLQERLARFIGGIAQINVGAATETELKDRKERAESALAAVKAALEEGVVTGGGIAFLGVAETLTKLKLEGDEQTGANVVRKALEVPFRQLMENSGHEAASIRRKINPVAKPDWGFDVRTSQLTSMTEAGILDAAKVVKSALRNASSIAQLLLTTNAAVTDIKEPGKAGGPPMPGGMPPGGMGGMPGMGGMDY